MRRVAAIIGLVGVVALVLFGQAAGGSDDTYEVRAIFDNGNFLVTGEEVRIAGARVGSVDSVDVTTPGEWVHDDHADDPGKAVVVMKITDDGFQDFREDASCLIRPQSLLGEKYVDCDPTQPRAPGSQPPPALDVVPDGDPGEGQHFLPLENNGQEVDLDLVNNIMRQPYADRFRLILNSLGAGLAARGKTLDAIVQRADPALRQTTRVLAVLAKQNQQLSRLAVDSDTILTPLVRERQHLAGFINNSNIAAEATAERSADLEAGFQKFPAAFHELRLTMAKLRGFSEQATPVFAQFRSGAPAIARATRALGPFAQSARPALTTLGTAAAQSQQPIVNSDPLLKKVRDLAKKTAPGAKSLARLLASLRKTGGYEDLMKFLFNTTGGVNGYDQYGHFLRAFLTIPPGCIQTSATRTLGCESNWPFVGSSASKRAALKMAAGADAAVAKAQAKVESDDGGTPAGSTGTGGSGGSGGIQPGQPLDAQGQPPAGTTTTTTTPVAPSARRPSLRAARDLLDTLIGRQRSDRGERP